MTSAKPIAIETLLNQDGENFVQACYRALLLRDADAKGLANHLAALTAGTSKLDLLVAIADSEEAHVKRMAKSPLAAEARHKLLMMQKSFIGRLGYSLSRLLQGAELSSENVSEQAITVIPSKTESTASNSSFVVVRKTPVAEWRKAIEAVRRTRSAVAGVPGRNCFWFDLTMSFQWAGGVFGVVRAELEMACDLHKLCPTIRFSMQIGNGFAEITADQIQWLLKAENVADAYLKFRGLSDNSIAKPGMVQVSCPDGGEFFHPYEKGDLLLSMGGIDSQKEEYLSRLKQEIPDIYIAYLIYDITVLSRETGRLSDSVSTRRFENYLKWISIHCDFVLYGSEAARASAEASFQRFDLPVPLGQAIKFGSDVIKLNPAQNSQILTAEVGVTRSFVLAVGSIEPRKNYETLYRAYLLAAELAGHELPQLIICGQPAWRSENFVDTLDRDPRLKNNVIHCEPTDLQLAALYKDCLFTFLPSVYEGWSPALPESLGYGKFCICADSPSFKEIGRDFVDYVDPYDVRGWAEKFIKYSEDTSLLEKKSAHIALEWANGRWIDAAEAARDFLAKVSSKYEPCGLLVAGVDISELWAPPAVTSPPKKASQPLWSPPTIWMDLTVSFLYWEGGVVGIVRAELTYAKFLMEQVPGARFFAYDAGHFFEVSRDMLLWLSGDTDLETSYKFFHQFWREHEQAGTGFRSPFRANGFDPNAPGYLSEFQTDAVVLFTAIDFGYYDENGYAHTYRTEVIEGLIKPGRCVLRSQIIYDYTPVLLPHFHVVETVTGYMPFLEVISNHFDYIVYGGRTAQRDGIALQKQQGWRIPASDFIEFGSDLSAGPKGSDDIEAEREVLARIGITGDFVMTVGTIQPRKNHEVLYMAYLTMLKHNILDKPLQMVFAGEEGWKSGDLLDVIRQDERIKGKIIIIAPTDVELDILYRHCQFTLLPSFYEGWSLTLPESLSYGKLALVADVDPLRETGGDLVEYIHPLDPHAWAERIAFFANHPQEVTERERKITGNWHVTSWSESTSVLVDMLYKRHKATYENLIAS